MRITTYSRDVKRDSTIGYEGYMVIGADTNLNKRWDFDMNTDKECLPLKMTCPKRPLSAYSNELERLISLSKSDLFDDAGRVSIQHIFVDNYAEIVRGNRPGWYISAFRVFWVESNYSLLDRRMKVMDSPGLSGMICAYALKPRAPDWVLHLPMILVYASMEKATPRRL